MVDTYKVGSMVERAIFCTYIPRLDPNRWEVKDSEPIQSLSDIDTQIRALSVTSLFFVCSKITAIPTNLCLLHRLAGSLPFQLLGLVQS